MSSKNSPKLLRKVGQVLGKSISSLLKRILDRLKTLQLHITQKSYTRVKDGMLTSCQKKGRKAKNRWCLEDQPRNREMGKSSSQKTSAAHSVDHDCFSQPRFCSSTIPGAYFRKSMAFSEEQCISRYLGLWAALELLPQGGE